MEIKRVGVIGAGQMGNGIAHVFALAGFDVVLHDVSEEALAAAPEIIRGNLDRQVARGKITAAERDAALGAHRASSASSRALGADRPRHRGGDRAARRSSTRSSRRWCRTSRPHTILTSNTSSISITRLASGTDRPERFMGFHFMNPVPVMQLVELIRGIATDEPTYQTLLGVVREDRQDRLLAPRTSPPSSSTAS